MKKSKPPRQKPGRKPKGGARVCLRLTHEVIAYYRALGDGCLTLGVERAAMMLR